MMFSRKSKQAIEQAPIKINMGCGYDKRPGWVNVDHFAGCDPDLIVELETLPWPWPDDVASEVAFNHSLEHLGREPVVFLGMMKELYRICANDAVVKISVPHPRHDDFINDPTHVRPITAQLMTLFDRRQCEHWIKNKASNTPLALQLSVDFVTENVSYSPDPFYLEELRQGRITGERLEELMRSQNNVASEINIDLRVRKPF